MKNQEINIKDIQNFENKILSNRSSTHDDTNHINEFLYE